MQLTPLSKAQLSNVLESVSLPRSTGNTNMQRMIEMLLSTPVPAKYNTCKEMQEMYVAVTGNRLRNDTTANTIREVKEVISDFDGIKRPDMSGDNWYQFVIAMVNFVIGQGSMLNDTFRFRLMTWKKLKSSLPTNPENRTAVLVQFRALKAWPQYYHYITALELENFELGYCVDCTYWE